MTINMFVYVVFLCQLLHYADDDMLMVVYDFLRNSKAKIIGVSAR